MSVIADRRNARRAPGAGARDSSSPGHREREVPILMYHEITGKPVSAPHLAVRPEEFARQLEFLREGGYTTLHAAEVAAALAAGRPLPAKPVVLTFDDGFASFHQSALPVLARYGYTATLYVTTGTIADAGEQARSAAGVGEPQPGMISWAQISEAAAAGIEIGAHTLSHPQLDQVSQRQVQRELRGSKDLLEDRLGRRVTGMSYPYGYTNHRVREAVPAAGYQYACAVANRIACTDDDRFELPRYTVGRTTRRAAFGRLVSGGRLPTEVHVYRALTKGGLVVRQSRSALHRIRAGE